MKIAHVLPTALPVTHDKGGAVERRVLEVATEQVAMGHVVTIFSAGEEGVFHVNGVTIHGVPCRFKRPLRDYEYLFRLRSAIRASRFDIIHSHGVPDAARVLARVANGATFVLTVDFFRYRLTEYVAGRRYFKGSLSRFRAICPVSEYCRSELLRFYGSDLNDRTKVVYNGVSLSQFYPDAREAERISAAYGIPQDSPYVVYLGRINRQKGSDLLPQLARQLQNVTVVAAGPVGQFGLDKRNEIIDDLRSSGGMYLGAVPDGDLRGLLSGARALVLPTRQDEMFGMVLVEAGACGTPAVASRLGGIPEAVGDGGILFQVGDVADLAEKTGRVVSGSPVRRSLSDAALKNSARFAWQNIARHYDDVYSR